MNVAEYIVEILRKNNITHVFGYQGGNITYMIDAIERREEIDYVQTYNEQGAAFAANSYAQVSQKFGVAVSSSGPGAINLINGIANAYYDSIPCLYITGNINTKSMRNSEAIRQNGFQEADIVGMVKGITKFAVTISDASNVPGILEQALHAMCEGRPGPVLLDIPHNIQRMDVHTEIGQYNFYKVREELDKGILAEISSKLQKAQRPVLLLGNGSRSAESKKLVLSLLGKVPMPVVSSLCGKDVISNMHPCYRGMIGSYALPYANKVLNEADFVLVLGSRMDERQRIVGVDEFLKAAEVIHIEIDGNEIGRVKKNELGIKCRVETFLKAFVEYVDIDKNFLEWIDISAAWMRDEVPANAWIFDADFKKKIEHILGDCIDNSVICVDVGNHQMASAQAVCVGENTNYLNSAGLGSMGYAIPAIIGAHFAAPDKKLVCITGDGGFMMNLQELQVIKREKIPVVFVVVNNQSLGMIVAYQALAFEGRYPGSKWGYEAADFKKIAEAFGIQYLNYRDADGIVFDKNEQSVLVEVEV